MMNSVINHPEDDWCVIVWIIFPWCHCTLEYSSRRGEKRAPRNFDKDKMKTNYGAWEIASNVMDVHIGHRQSTIYHFYDWSSSNHHQFWLIGERDFRFRQSTSFTFKVRVIFRVSDIESTGLLTTNHNNLIWPLTSHTYIITGNLWPCSSTLA